MVRALVLGDDFSSDASPQTKLASKAPQSIKESRLRTLVALGLLIVAKMGLEVETATVGEVKKKKKSKKRTWGISWLKTAVLWRGSSRARRSVQNHRSCSARVGPDSGGTVDGRGARFLRSDCALSGPPQTSGYRRTGSSRRRSGTSFAPGPSQKTLHNLIVAKEGAGADLTRRTHAWKVRRNSVRLRLRTGRRKRASLQRDTL